MKHKRYRGKFLGNQKHLPIWLWVIPAVLLVVGVSAIAMILSSRYQIRQEYAQMAAAVQEVRQTLPEPTMAPTKTTVSETESTETTVPVTEPTGPLVQYLSLSQENPDFVGWLKIEGTTIDYPVMHTPEEPEKYLHKNFQGQHSVAGIPFIDYRCKADSDNLLIYGHNMSDGSMFHRLVDYQQKKHWETHPLIRFDSLYQEREYKVVAAFYDRIYYTHENVFKFYNFIDAADETEYNSTVATLKSKSLYDTGVTPQYGQQLITLVTCTYHVENGRFVVVACEKPVD